MHPKIGLSVRLLLDSVTMLCAASSLPQQKDLRSGEIELFLCCRHSSQLGLLQICEDSIG